MSPINLTCEPDTIDSTLFGGTSEFTPNLLNKLKVSYTDPADVRTLPGDHWGLPNDQIPAAATEVVEHNFTTGAITGIQWVLSGDMDKDITAPAARSGRMPIKSSG